MSLVYPTPRCMRGKHGECDTPQWCGCDCHTAATDVPADNAVNSDAEADPYTAHTDCDTAARAGTEQTCDRCGRTLTVTPWDDFYCAADSPDHCCEACLVQGRPIAHIDPEAPLDEPMFRTPAGGAS